MNAPAPTADPKSLIGQWLPGGYRLEKFIGAGAFAWVYYATTPRHDALAVKVLQASSEEARTLFAREIKVLRQLPPSPYCVAYVDDGVTDDGMSFLVMEYIDGCTLKDAFKFKPVWQVDEACYIMIQMCDALAGLHRLGVAHRDLKPENVMVTREWQVKLMDFGLVKDAQGLLKLFESEDILTGRDFAENVDKAMLAGTPEYMAPEQFLDPMQDDESQAKTDTWSDVYSLGLIFYQLLIGTKLFPFRPAGNEQGAYARAMLAYIKQRTTFQDAHLVRPDAIPRELWPAVQIALRQNPKQRHHNAVELGDSIRRYLQTGTLVDDFRDDEHTSMADMAQLLAATSGDDVEKTSMGAWAPFPNAESSSVRPRSVRPPAPEIEMSFEPHTGVLPSLDVGAVQAYRQQRLAVTGRMEETLPPGQLHSRDVFPGGVPPAAVNPSLSPSWSSNPGPPPVALRPTKSFAWLGVTAGVLLVAGALTAAWGLHVCQRPRFVQALHAGRICHVDAHR